MPDLLFSSWVNIASKIRRLTRNPSESQLSSLKIVAYINDFILYDMPARVELNSLKDVFTFYTTPGQAEYKTVIGPANIGDAFYHFKDYYSTVNAPVYVGGESASFTQSVAAFHSSFPRVEQRINIGSGNGVVTAFAGTVSNIPILKGSVYISSISTANKVLIAKDNSDGGFTGDVTGAGSIDYETGVYNFNFNHAVKNNATVWFTCVPYVASKPTAILLSSDKLVLAPVPDKVYKVTLSVNRRPHEVLSVTPGAIIPNLMPELSGWWQYIAIGASCEILQDRLDFDTLAQVEPELKKQELLVNRRKIKQNSSKRSQTIFSSTIERSL